MKLPSLIQSSFRPFYDFVFPPLCLVCEALLTTDERKICTRCWDSISPVKTTDQLFVEMHQRLTNDGTVDDLISKYHFERDGALQQMLHHLKYSGMTGLGVMLGKQVGYALHAQLLDPAESVLVPIPLHPIKKRERGYNQSAFICKGISEVTSMEVADDVLVRKRYTETQTQLDIEERKTNVAAAFDLKGNAQVKLAGRTVLLVDDVITTGATIMSCARLLKKSGADRVAACSVALADHTVIP